LGLSLGGIINGRGAINKVFHEKNKIVKINIKFEKHELSKHLGWSVNVDLFLEN